MRLTKTKKTTGKPFILFGNTGNIANNKTAKFKIFCLLKSLLLIFILPDFKFITFKIITEF